MVAAKGAIYAQGTSKRTTPQCLLDTRLATVHIRTPTVYPTLRIRCQDNRSTRDFPVMLRRTDTDNPQQSRLLVPTPTSHAHSLWGVSLGGTGHGDSYIAMHSGSASGADLLPFHLTPVRQAQCRSGCRCAIR